MVLDLLHPIFYFPIWDQILRLLKMVPSDYSWPKTLDLSPKTFSTMFRTKVTISCLQVVLGLLQHLDPVLDLQIKWFPQPQNIGMIPKLCLKHDQNQSYNFSPWGRSGPSTDSPPCSWPSDRSEAPENGLQWFPLPKNSQFDTKIVSLARSEPIENVQKIQVFVSHCAVYRFTAKTSAGLRDL